MCSGLDVWRLVVRQNSDCREASAKHANRSATHQKTQLAGRFWINECQDHHGYAYAAHSERHADADNFPP